MMESCLTREELLSNLNNGGVKMELLATGNTAGDRGRFSVSFEANRKSEPIKGSDSF